MDDRAIVQADQAELPISLLLGRNSQRHKDAGLLRTHSLAFNGRHPKESWTIMINNRSCRHVVSSGAIDGQNDNQ